MREISMMGRGGEYFHVPPMPELFSTIIKLRYLLRVRRSMAMHMPTSAHSVIHTRSQARNQAVGGFDSQSTYQICPPR
jgi:hypothetical protein